MAPSPQRIVLGEVAAAAAATAGRNAPLPQRFLSFHPEKACKWRPFYDIGISLQDPYSSAAKEHGGGKRRGEGNKLDGI